MPPAEIRYRLIDQMRAFPGGRPCVRCGHPTPTTELYRQIVHDGRRRSFTCRPCVVVIANQRRMTLREDGTDLVLAPEVTSQPAPEGAREGSHHDN